MCRQEKAARASPQEDRAFQQGQHSNQCPTSPEAGGRRPSLEYSQYQCTCCASRKYLHPSNSREKRGQVCMSQRQINVTTNPAALLEESIILSFHFLTAASVLAQGWLLMLFVQFPVHHTTVPCDVGKSTVFPLWMGCASPSSSLPAQSPGSHSWSLPGPPRCLCSAPEDGRQ